MFSWTCKLIPMKSHCVGGAVVEMNHLGGGFLTLGPENFSRPMDFQHALT